MAVNDETLRLLFDGGSVALKVLVTDVHGTVLEQHYVRTQGRPLEAAMAVLGALIQRRPRHAWDLVAGTGSAGRVLCDLLGVPFVNEVLCQAVAVRHLCPAVRTLVEMGGQDSKLILLDGGESPILDFAMNTSCAAGTGSFLDQQAARLGIRIEEEFGRLAVQSLSPPRVAGRCSVFAKSDMIHLQQQATPVPDILAGLCRGLARNLRSNLARGRDLPRPLAFCGGVAANAGVVRAVAEVFELAAGELFVPEQHAFTGALGAGWVVLRERARRGAEYGRPPGGVLVLAPLARPGEPAGNGTHPLAPLAPPPAAQAGTVAAACGGACDRRHTGCVHTGTVARLRSAATPPTGDWPAAELVVPHAASAPAEWAMPPRPAPRGPHRGPPQDAYVGLDVGSISTKVAVLDADNQLLAKLYLMTAGQPLDAVRRILQELPGQLGTAVRIGGVATTGSGRYLTGDLVGADLVVNEITAQATAAAALDPEVDTIFEIGGQDSKYISLDQGVVVDFEMNHACAAGTGSFLEEQAARLGVRIDRQFADLALRSRHPLRLGERCTVFIESDLVSHQQQGAALEDLVSGLCYAIVTNYLNRVVGRRRVGQRIFFQGGTAFNQGVVAAFEKVVGRPITVPPHHEVTGAIGAAVLARQHQQRHRRTASRFRGFELSHVSCQVRSFTCDSCSNACEINEVQIPNREPLHYGSRCDRFNVQRGPAAGSHLPNLFAERHQLLLRHAHLDAAKHPGRPTVGIPLALSNYQLLPFWGTLLGALGLNVVVSPMSTGRILQQGIEAVLSTPCFPVKVAHGHVLHLVAQQVDYVWAPSVLNLPRDGDDPHNTLCPYVAALPYEVAPAFAGPNGGPRLLRPVVRFQEGRHAVLSGLQPLAKELRVSRRQLRRAVHRAWQAQTEFEEACRTRGRQALQTLAPGQRAVVLVSRPYTGCDSGAYLNLPAKLRKLGVVAIPMDFLDLGERAANDDPLFRAMYWRYGQRILRAAEVIRAEPRLHAVYLSNFSCGPDSFLIGYFKRVMAPKPALVLEIDEHSADAGALTRLEAFLEGLAGTPMPSPARSPAPHRSPAPPSRNGRARRTLYFPWMGDQSYGLAAAFRAFGQPAEVMPVADQQSLELGRRYCSGKECLPCILTAGDMIRVVQRPGFDPARAAFFMPGGSGPCRFGQYQCLHRLILGDLGVGAVPVVAPSADRTLYEDWGHFARGTLGLAWTSLCVFDVLQKARLATRPYEREPQRTDAVYQAWAQRLCALIETRPREAAVVAALAGAATDFAAIPVDRRPRRPRIGVVGEIYIRHHEFGNDQLLRQLESLGAETTASGFPEWHYYTNWLRMEDAWRNRRWHRWLVNFVHDRLQRRRERRLNAACAPLLGLVAEPPTAALLKLAEPYVHPSLRGGEAVLSVGKMIELSQHGCHGAINVMPFGCMPSTIVDGVMKSNLAALRGMPVLSISYDGHQDPALQTRLEAFLDQARAYAARQNGHGA